MQYKLISKNIVLLVFSSVAGLSQAVVSNMVTPTSTVTQLTDYASTYVLNFESRDPDISKDGSTVVFTSTADLVPGGNPDNLDNVYVMNSDGTGLRQLSFATIDPTHQNSIPYFTSAPRVSADGSVVVFASTNNLTGDNPPELISDPDFPNYTYYIPNTQIFIVNSDGSGLRQLTAGTGGDSRFPRISNDGTIVAFQSTQDLLGENPDLTEEIYVIRADGSDLTQVTKGLPKPDGANVRDDASRNVSISGDGTTLAFDSFADLISPKNDDLSDEIFVFDLAGYWADGATINDLGDYTVQVTDTDIDAPFHIRAEDAFEPSLSHDGTWVAFSGCINPNGNPDPDNYVPGDNPFLPDVIFLAKRDGTGLRQLTFSDDPNAYTDDANWANIDDDAHWPEISADGSKIVFSSRSRVDIVNEALEYELAMIDLNAPVGPDGRPVVTQLTYGSTDGARLRPSISADADMIAVRSNSDFTGGNPDGNSEIFLVEPTVAATEPVTDDENDSDSDSDSEQDKDKNKDKSNGKNKDKNKSKNKNKDNNRGGNSDDQGENDNAADDANQNGIERNSSANASGSTPSSGVAAFGLGELFLALVGVVAGVTGRRQAPDPGLKKE